MIDINAVFRVLYDFSSGVVETRHTLRDWRDPTAKSARDHRSKYQGRKSARLNIQPNDISRRVSRNDDDDDDQKKFFIKISGFIEKRTNIVLRLTFTSGITNLSIRFRESFPLENFVPRNIVNRLYRNKNVYRPCDKFAPFQTYFQWDKILFVTRERKDPGSVSFSWKYKSFFRLAIWSPFLVID